VRGAEEMRRQVGAAGKGIQEKLNMRNHLSRCRR